MSRNAPRMYLLDPERLDRIQDDPALAGLAASGWTVVSSQLIEHQSTPGKPMLGLLLWPPASRLLPSPNVWRMTILAAGFGAGIAVAVLAVLLMGMA